MEEKRMPTVQSNQNWKKENTVMVGLRLMKKTDMDIIETLQSGDGTMQARLRHLLRLGIAYEQQGGTAPAPSTEEDRETQRLLRVAREYEEMTKKGWRMQPPKKEEDERKPLPDLRNINKPE